MCTKLLEAEAFARVEGCLMYLTISRPIFKKQIKKKNILKSLIFLNFQFHYYLLLGHPIVSLLRFLYPPRSDRHKIAAAPSPLTPSF